MIELGLQSFLRTHQDMLKGRRVGLVTHAAAITPDFRSNVDLFLEHRISVTALFAPEHGFDGAGADATPMPDENDSRRNLPIYSLYGEFKEPNSSALNQVDVLVFEMQDVGARFYTFISTLEYVLRAAADANKELIVLDRPNPLNGTQMEGPLVDDGLESFISQLRVPIRHALTTGEIARLIVHTFQLDVSLTVVPMRGWQRAMWFDETGLPWIPLSPAMPHFSTALTYPGTCLLEGTNVSEGRGTALPFEIIGAPWLDGYALAQSLNRLDLPGVVFRAHAFVPSDSKHRGLKCGGVQVHITNRNEFRPVYTGLHLIAECRAQNRERFEFLATSWEGAPPHLDLLCGTARVRQGLSAEVPVKEIVADWETITRRFRESCAPILLYA
ncbi:MAG: DUF1343 domain-containing protein [Chloroflexota bacterium]|nr:MAG: DUF1343 domain-containing protein [Chloroflexota bacterium]